MKKGTRGSTAWRARLPVVTIVVVSVAVLTTAVTGAAKPPPGIQEIPGGHWVYNSLLQAAFHIDGGTAGIDAQVAVPGDPGSQVVQGDTSGYVVGGTRITPFGKSDLTAGPPGVPPSGEVPVAVETAGGPYLVYRQAGRIIRLGDPPAPISAGGRSATRSPPRTGRCGCRVSRPACSAGWTAAQTPCRPARSRCPQGISAR
ncbi:hypothetical protein [Amycolatopsis sp. EV170708-02-1]|uniref:hypothetical protein n=1 Tax=Amycolatopsis sp. EV170708-02-1 TaxID=2919322 RepID=UPI001F0B768A|nr:hypothetical protein [Amycolatopsis sp. EV170708-02-1]UMP01331.1 hypothetical protein MJQ72_33595 [Amycolatopsis sp. EV170708-02-1]